MRGGSRNPMRVAAAAATAVCQPWNRPDTRLTTYDDSGWTMGLLMAVDVKEIADAAVLKVPLGFLGGGAWSL